MANVWAIKSGDWSDTTLWNTGALPTSADDVYANNFNVNVNQNITVNSLRNTANTGVTAGGTFAFNTGGVTVNITTNIYNSSSLLINVNASSGNIVLNVPTANIIMGSNLNSSAISHSGNCNLTFTASLLGFSGNHYNSKAIINKTSTSALTINANISAPAINDSSGSACVFTTAATGSITINGNISGSIGGSNVNYSVWINGGGSNLTINGNLTGGIGVNSLPLVFSSIGTLNIIGNISGQNSIGASVTAGTANVTGVIMGGTTPGVVGLSISGTATLNHIGTAQASASASAITCNTPTASVVTCTGPFLKNGYIVAIASQTLRINFGSNSYFQFKKSNGEDIDYVSTIEGYNYPATNDVRYGVSYKSGLAIGTCHVPTPDNVRKNIPVDNTVGTSDNVNAEDILEAIQNSTLPIAERLRNVATVESTGAQLEAYQ